MFRFPLAEFLGAKGDTITLLSAYIAGYAPGIIGQVLSGVLTAFLPFNNDTRRSYAGITIMIVSNIGMDLLNVFVLHQGTFGMGLATSVSYLLSTGVLLMSYLNKEHVLRLRMSGFCFNKLPKAAYLGLPSLMFTVGCTAKGYILNLTLMQYVGDAAVAVMNVQNNIISILGAIPQGCAGALMTLAAMYYGDEDRGSFTIRIRDDCPAFDPKKYLDQFNPEDPAKNIGIRMIAKKAKEMIYQNVAGINTLLVKV